MLHRLLCLLTRSHVAPEDIEGGRHIACVRCGTHFDLDAQNGIEAKLRDW